MSAERNYRIRIQENVAAILLRTFLAPKVQRTLKKAIHQMEDDPELKAAFIDYANYNKRMISLIKHLAKIDPENDLVKLYRDKGHIK